MWYTETVFYQLYPLGFCSAPSQNDGIQRHGIQKVTQWIPHLQQLGVGAVLFNPLFESDSHGYDTRNFKKLDTRLGTNEDFADVCRQLKNAGIKVVLDGSFNHVGRGFWAFENVRKEREDSLYKDWFHIDFSRNSNYNDGFWYEGWEGHYELVKLNLHNPQVVEYLLECVQEWIDLFGIDGIRLDVAYCLNHGFMQSLRNLVGRRESFFLVGEMLHGDYKTIACPDMLHSATNYECYKGMYSSLNSKNFFEIAHSLNRQFGPEDWTLYKGIPLFNFVDNHDVTRAASILQDENHLPVLYGILFGIPGIPCIYYGSEWGAKGEKQAGSDAALRPAFEHPQKNALFNFLKALSLARRKNKALCNGSYRQVYLTNTQFVFEREHNGERILVALNAEPHQHTAHFETNFTSAQDIITEKTVLFEPGTLLMEPYSVQYLQLN